MHMFNPKLKDFIEQNPNKSLLGFAWSCYWRLQVVILVIYLALVIVFLILGLLVSLIERLL